MTTSLVECVVRNIVVFPIAGSGEKETIACDPELLTILLAAAAQTEVANLQRIFFTEPHLTTKVTNPGLAARRPHGAIAFDC